MISVRAICAASLALMVVSVVLANAASAQLTDPIPAPIAKGSVRIELQTVADGLVAPNLLTHAGDGSDRLFVVDQVGEIRLINSGVLQATPYLNARNLLVPLGAFGPGSFDERGLLGLAFHPNFEIAGQPGFGKFYTYTSEPVGPTADFTVPIPAGQSFNNQAVLREWTVDPSANVITGDPNVISRELMRINDPNFNHNAGMVEFGPDGHLYVAIGDGGAANDVGVGHTLATGNAQDRTNIFGNILRINPLGNNSANGKYGIPVDNPFVGDPTALDEIYAWGFRNPFRFSFDVDPATGLVTPDTTGRLIAADVGQNNIEEVDIVTAGDNYGWRLKEGSFFFNFESGEVDDEPFDDPDIVIPGGFDPVDPAIEYDHDEGISIIGGYVYNGSAIPALDGKYVFGDFTNGGFVDPNGRIFFGDLDSGEIQEFVIGLNDRALGLFVKGFGQDANGELYLLGGTGNAPFPVNGVNTGVVMRLVLVPEPATLALVGVCCAIAAGWRRRSLAHKAL